MSRSRPTIGVTGPDVGGTAAWWFTAWAVWRAGGWPVRIRPGRPRDTEKLDGLILGGGADIGDPTSIDFGHMAPRLTTWRRWTAAGIWALKLLLRRRKRPARDEARDALEFRLVQDALDRKLPILGICRGAQLLNLHFGGTLHEEIEGFYGERPTPRSVFPTKVVQLRPGSRLASILGRTECRVNALHHQAVNRVARGFSVVAQESNGLHQAIERDGDEWIIGVQWHPEFLPQIKRHQALFRALIHEAECRHPRTLTTAA
ncbi:MAG: gamma-glutamyl-gamma-aminobutyrate hydrolase family protein [Myxococcota bacterium]